MSQTAANPSQRARLFDRPLPPGYRDELQALIAERPADPPRQSGSSLLFQLGELRLALPTRIASAVAPILHIARIPHRSGTVLLGLAAFRGDILPCCSLARLLGIPHNLAETHAGAARTLILEESPGRRWAIPIDGVLGIRMIDGQLSTEAGPLAAQWLKGSFLDNAGAGKIEIGTTEIDGEGIDGTGIDKVGIGKDGTERSTVFHLLDHEVLFRQITLATA